MLPSKNKTKASVFRSAPEKASLISAYRKSGQSMSQFCRENDLAISSFSTWVNKTSDEMALTNRSGVEGSSCFVELEPVENDIPPTEVNLDAKQPCAQVLKLQLGKTLTLELRWREQ